MKGTKNSMKSGQLSQGVKTPVDNQPEEGGMDLLQFPEESTVKKTFG